MDTNNPLADATDLASLVERGWDLHASDPQAVAQALLARAGSLGPDAAGAIVLADHVWLAHLADVAGLRAFLAALPAAALSAEACQAVLARVRWTLAMADGQPPPETADAGRWRGMGSLWSLWIAAGRLGDVEAMLQAETPRALAHPEAASRSALAATCNNLTVALREGPRGDARRDALTLALGRASRELWASAGTWVNVERADYQLARCHAAIGQGTEAVAHARSVLAAIDQHADDPQADAFERFFAHEAMAWALRAAGEAGGAAEQRAQMQRWLAEVADEGSRAWCAQALADFDAAAG